MKKVAVVLLVIAALVSICACGKLQVIRCSQYNKLLDGVVWKSDNSSILCDSCSNQLTNEDQQATNANKPAQGYVISNYGEPHDPYDVHGEGYYMIANTPSYNGVSLLQYYTDQTSVIGTVEEGQIVKARAPYTSLDNGYVMIEAKDKKIMGWVPVGYMYPVNPYADSGYTGEDLTSDMYARVSFGTPDDAGINLRASASSDSELMLVLHEGTIVDVQGSYSADHNGYIQIGYNHPNAGEYMVGWVLARYLEFYGYR